MTSTSHPSDASRTVLSITGMTCGGCANTVTRVLQGVPGVVRAEVELEGAQALVEGTAPAADLVAAAEGAGFGAAVLEPNG